MADTLHILDDLQLDENLRLVQIGDVLSPLELSKTDIRATGDLEVEEKLKVGGDLKVVGNITGSSFGDIVADSITRTSVGDLDISATNGDITLTPTGADVKLNTNAGVTMVQFAVTSGYMSLFDATNQADSATLYVTTNGATGLSTTDADAALAHLTLDADGDIILDAHSGIIHFRDAGDTDDAFKITVVGGTGATTLETISDAADGHLTLDSDGELNLDAGLTDDDFSGILLKQSGTTFGSLSAHHGASIFLLAENAGASLVDYFKIKCEANGASTIETVDDAGADAHLSVVADGHVEFDGCGVGFDLVTPTYNASDTDVSFITGNKQFVTFGSGNITDLNLIFPKTSGNFTLLLKQDGTGSRTVTNYKVWDVVNSDAASGSATVKFAGGSNPTLTTDANHVDIISFFYDADNQIAYGVASLDFQF